jgi:hypothetical protein
MALVSRRLINLASRITLPSHSIKATHDLGAQKKQQGHSEENPDMRRAIEKMRGNKKGIKQRHGAGIFKSELGIFQKSQSGGGFGHRKIFSRSWITN